MKKILSFVPFVIACCLLIGAIGWGVLVIYDTCREVERLASLPSASGVDYFFRDQQSGYKKWKSPHCVRRADGAVRLAFAPVSGSVYVEVVLITIGK